MNQFPAHSHPLEIPQGYILQAHLTSIYTAPTLLVLTTIVLNCSSLQTCLRGWLWNSTLILSVLFFCAIIRSNKISAWTIPVLVLQLWWTSNGLLQWKIFRWWLVKMDQLSHKSRTLRILKKKNVKPYVCSMYKNNGFKFDINKLLIGKCSFLYIILSKFRSCLWKGIFFFFLKTLFLKILSSYRLDE